MTCTARELADYLAANLEGNNFTAQQLGDLVETLIAGKESARRQ